MLNAIIWLVLSITYMLLWGFVWLSDWTPSPYIVAGSAFMGVGMACLAMSIIELDKWAAKQHASREPER
jgi:hypothetical protein